MIFQRTLQSVSFIVVRFPLLLETLSVTDIFPNFCPKVTVQGVQLDYGNLTPPLETFHQAETLNCPISVRS